MRTLPAIHHEIDAHRSWAERLDDMAKRGGLEVRITRVDGSTVYGRVCGSGVDPTDQSAGLRYRLTNAHGVPYGPEHFMRSDEFVSMCVL
jgi:hypothetical protein